MKSSDNYLHLFDQTKKIHKELFANVEMRDKQTLVIIEPNSASANNKKQEIAKWLVNHKYEENNTFPIKGLLPVIKSYVENRTVF